jgi:hypothetical protein
MSPTPPKPRERWQLLIGSLILACGELEQAVHVIWKRCFGSKPEPQTLSLRIDKLIGRVKSDQSLSSAIPELLVEIKRLLEYRNVVAHHALSLHLHRHEVSRKITPVLQVASRSADVQITEAELRSLVQQAERISRELTSAFWLRELDE